MEIRMNAEDGSRKLFVITGLMLVFLAVAFVALLKYPEQRMGELGKLNGAEAVVVMPPFAPALTAGWYKLDVEVLRSNDGGNRRTVQCFDGTLSPGEVVILRWDAESDILVAARKVAE
jgi:hypothetical protein